MRLGKRATAEFVGTSWLVFGGCGTAVRSAAFRIGGRRGAVNPARSTGPALFVRGWAIEQLWLFWWRRSPEQ